MTEQQKQQLARQIVQVAKKAGAMIAQNKASQITEKGDVANLVTDMDVKSQKLILEECAKILPQSCFLAEEENQQQIGDGFTWIVDPIDGTTNYLYDFRHSCISIALYYQKKGLIGVVYNPYLDECFVGIDGMPSTCNGTPIQVSENSVREALVMVGTSPYNKPLADKTFDTMKRIFLHTRDLRRSGSAALDLCYVAAGRIDAFYEEILQPWDYAAGLIVIENAGGKFTPIVPQAYEQLKTTGMVCSNAVCHADFCKLVSGT